MDSTVIVCLDICQFCIPTQKNPTQQTLLAFENVQPAEISSFFDLTGTDEGFHSLHEGVHANDFCQQIYT